MRIFCAGIMTETNTFCTVPTALEDFLICRGRDNDGIYPSLDLSLSWGQLALSRGDEFVFSLMAFAQPAGMTVKSAYEGMRDEILRDLEDAGPVDIVLLMLHGAMVADGYASCETDLVTRIRDVAGPSAIIGIELDLHCNITDEVLEIGNIIITYKEYPHVDLNERAKELFDISVAAKIGDVRPTMSVFNCHMSGLYPTSRQPMRAIVDDMIAAEDRPGILSISFAHGFPFADVGHAGARVLVITDSDQALADTTAREFGTRIYGHRDRIGLESLAIPLEEALDRARRGSRGPVVVADQADNIGGGAPGDSTYALRWLLDQQANDVAIAILHDPEAVKIAKKAGVGARLPLRIGGKTSVWSGAPIDIEVEVTAIRDNYVVELPQRSGETWVTPAGDLVALRCGTIEIVLGSERCQCTSPLIFSDLGIDLPTKQVVVVKSTQHFYAAFEPIAAEIIYMAAPGALAPDPRQLTYATLNTSHMYPWTEDPLMKQGED